MNLAPRIRPSLATFLLLILTGCGHFEEVSSQGSLRGEAAANPLLAAERFINAMGLPATSRDSLPANLPEDSVLVLSGERLRSPGPPLERCLNWIARGQHALVFLDGFAEDPPPGSGASQAPFALLEELQVRRLEYGDASWSPDPEGNEDPDEGFEIILDTSAGLLTTQGRLPSAVLPMQYGKGGITLITDGRSIARAGLGDFDHAPWFWDLLQAGPKPPKAALLVYGGRPSLASLITKHFPMMPWALLVLLCLALWRAAARFGPVLDEAPPARLGFDRHVFALGSFFWYRGSARSLVEAWRQRVVRKAQASLHFPVASDGDLLRSPGFIEAMAERSGRSSEGLRKALISEHYDQADAFTQVIADLQDIEQAL